LMQVIDDGCGMSREDARLAVQRFATSKIKEWEDLDNLFTLGFRGEALPSIAAVSRLEIRTCQAGDLEGTLLTMEGASEPNLSVCAAVPGTRITVRDLFYNTPARLKFLRSAGAESAQIIDLLGRLAAAWPEVAFTLHSNEREIFSFTADMGSDKRLAKLWKLDSTNFIPIFDSAEGMSIDGFVARPDVAKSNRTYQLFVMNGRVIRSQNLSQALLEGFSPLVEKGRFPVGMLRLTVDPAFVDVNVHPTKLEVRFAEPRPVFSLVYRAVSKALEAYRADSVLPKHFDFLARKAEAQREVPTTASRIDETCAVEKKSENDDMAVVEAKKTLPASQVERQKGASGRLYFPESAFNKKPLEKEITLSSKASVGKAKLALELYTPFNGDRAVLDCSQASQSANSGDECQQRTEIANKVAAEPQQEKVIAASEVERHSDYLQQSELWHGTNATEVPQFKVLGQVYKTFIVGLCEGKLWLVDQHTAQERINYEKFANIQALSERSQGLLIPEIVEFTPQVSQFLQDSLDSFCEYGYEVENFGPDRFALRGVPVALPLQKAAATFAELVEELAGEFISVRGNVREHMREKIRAMASCKAAVKAGDVLSFEAMEGLVNNMLKVEHSLYCPHGRPTRIILEEKVLERLFHRI
ncbi:TPA: hypothetical protein DD394_03605, partial [bacterium UBP9_UBA11836]|nr:hypothetical protein [bacterium UBP9_UBA11836]